MKVRRTRSFTLGAALGLAALVAVIGAAQAAPQTKKFSATVNVANNVVSLTSATLTLTVTNKTRSQTLGSAEFGPPLGVTELSDVSDPGRPGWDASIVDGKVRLSSTTNALGINESVSANVSVKIDQGACGDAGAWVVRAKQSNDFSGNPGNDFQFDPQGSDLIALGRFDIATIQTITDDEQAVPAIETDKPYVSTTTAYDICGEKKTTYTGATRTRTGLTGATYVPSTGLDWSAADGTGKLTITPAATETDNKITVTDPTSGVTASSNFFDTTDRLCTSTDDPVAEPCNWSEDRLTVKSDRPPTNASLGIGFNSALTFVCGTSTSTVKNTPLVNINPRFELLPLVKAIDVTMTYEKAATGSGPASSFKVCLRKDTETTWNPLGPCGSTAPETACIKSMKRVTGGALEIVLSVATDDPWTGLG